MQERLSTPVPSYYDANVVFTDPAPVRSAFQFGRVVFMQGFKPTVILLYTVLALTIWKYVPNAPRITVTEPSASAPAIALGDERVQVNFLTSDTPPSYGVVDFVWNARKLWLAFFLMGVIPACIVKFVFREKLADYGLSFGVKRRTLVNILLFLPVFVVMGWLSGADTGFYAVYPFNPLAGVSYGALITHSIMYVTLYYLAWEFMFRGFIQHGLLDVSGAPTAVCVQVLASTMLHYGHPASETFSCIAGGLFWGYLALRTRSIFAGCCHHAVLGVLLDWSLILNAG